ncbi:hypothetical protein ACFL2S_14985, partial [Thermodesulfobacteriota bacterium]
IVLPVGEEAHVCIPFLYHQIHMYATVARINNPTSMSKEYCFIADLLCYKAYDALIYFNRLQNVII